MIQLAWPMLVLVLIAIAVVAGLAAAAVAYRSGVASGQTSTRRECAAPLAAAEAEARLLREQVHDLRAADEQENETVLAMAPLQSALARMERHVERLERDRSAQFGEMGERLREVSRATAGLKDETATLAGSLNASTIRGSWGESQLRRVLEHGGLLPRCDFDEQVTAHAQHDVAVRPDVVVRLPGEKTLVIDAKAPMSRFLDAQSTQASAEQRAGLLADHAAHLRRHVNGLAAKQYWTAFTASPEMVVCFVPGDAVLAAALDADSALFDEAMTKKVVLASPSTLLALARTVAYTWKQESLTQNARELLALGSELHARIRTVGGHLDKMGGSLRRSVDSYNSLVGAIESRVLVTARRMEALGLVTDEIANPATVDNPVRQLTSPELLEALDSGSGGRDDDYLTVENERAHPDSGPEAQTHVGRRSA